MRWTMITRIFAVAVLATTACTRAPLIDPKIGLRGASRGEVPRDVNGEPLMDRVKPVPSNALLPASPPKS